MWSQKIWRSSYQTRLGKKENQHRVEFLSFKSKTKKKLTRKCGRRSLERSTESFSGRFWRYLCLHPQQYTRSQGGCHHWIEAFKYLNFHRSLIIAGVRLHSFSHNVSGNNSKLLRSLGQRVCIPMCNEKTSDKLVLSFLPVHVMTVMPQFVAEVS